MPALYQLTAQYRELQALSEQEEIDHQIVKDTLEALTGSIEDKAKAVAMVVENLTISAGDIRTVAKQMIARAERLERRAESVRDYLLNNMQATGIRKIECEYFVLNVRKNPSKVVIDSPGLIPSELYVYPPAPEPYPDKKAIAEYLKAGKEVNGAHLEQTERLEIKV